MGRKDTEGPAERVAAAGTDSRGMDAIFGDFDLAHATKREEKFHKVLWRVLRGLAQDMPDRIGHSRVEQHSADLQAGKVDAHCLARLKHWHVPSPFDCHPVIGDLQEWLFCFVGGEPQFLVTDKSCVYREESVVLRPNGLVPFS